MVTNPYTRGLKELMFAFVSKTSEEKEEHFKTALDNLFHIKYYYLEALYYYCLFLKEINSAALNLRLSNGLSLCKKFKYQYLDYLFQQINSLERLPYNFTYSYYPIDNLEGYVKKHNEKWEKEFRNYEDL